jgi:probable addiction module antidote protein
MKKNKKRQHGDFQEYLLKKLQNPKLALGYLNEALMDEDQRVFLLALKDVLAAQGGDMTALAEEANLNRQNMYRMLSKKGNPRWDSITSLFNVLGLQVKLSLKK